MPRLFNSTVVRNLPLCREHFRLVLSGPAFERASPGQFLHIGGATNHQTFEGTHSAPMLRRAFSIAGLRDTSPGQCEMDVIYRVVGSATGWMESLRPGDWASVMGPMGNTFPIHPGKSKAILVAGGVGLPPMLWLAEWLHHVGKQVVACVGARSADLLPLTIEAENEVADASPVARMAAVEFAEFGTPVVISTDDGSMGFAGHIAAAFSAYFDQAGVESSQTVVYTCGPERMMHVVADFCLSRGIECYVCMERAMACGTGTCQSCVVSVHDQEAVDGWRYELCCTQGPVFDASRVIWS